MQVVGCKIYKKISVTIFGKNSRSLKKQANPRFGYTKRLDKR